MMEELELEKAARRIEGESLSRVYYQSAGGADSPAWAGPGPHPVQLAVYLEMASGQIFRVYWADQFNLHHGHGIAIARTPVIDRDLGPAAGGGAQINDARAGAQEVEAVVKLG